MSKTYHILNGDALLDLLPDTLLYGEIIVARECLVDGPLHGETPDEFWKTRSAFIAAEYDEEEALYYQDVVPEFNRLAQIPAGSEVNLWFEEDLFCQANLWFCTSLLMPVSDKVKINRIKPPLIDGKPDWRGFGALDRNGLAKAYQDRQRLSAEETELANSLWTAFKTNDRSGLAQLANVKTNGFPFLDHVVQAHLDRFSEDNISGRPENVLKDIIAEKNTRDFDTIFKEFGTREGIYGFGDWQIKSILNRLPEYKSD